MKLLQYHDDWDNWIFGGTAEVPGGKFPTSDQNPKLAAVSKGGPRELKLVVEFEDKLYDISMELDAGYEVNDELLEKIMAFRGKPLHEIAVVNTDCACLSAETAM